MQAEELFLNSRSLLHIIFLFCSLHEITSHLWLCHDKVLHQLFLRAISGVNLNLTRFFFFHLDSLFLKQLSSKKTDASLLISLWERWLAWRRNFCSALVREQHLEAAPFSGAKHLWILDQNQFSRYKHRNSKWTRTDWFSKAAGTNATE